MNNNIINIDGASLIKKTISSSAVKLNNQIYSIPPNKSIIFGNKKYWIVSPQNHRLPIHLWVRFSFSCGSFCVGVSQTLVKVVLANLLSSKDVKDLSEDLKLALLEVACESWLELLEVHLGEKVTFDTVCSKSVIEEEQNVALVVFLRGEDDSAEKIHLRCTESLVEPLYKILGSEVTSEEQDVRDSLLLPIRATFGSSEILHHHLKELSSGDVIIITKRCCNNLNQIRVLIGSNHYVLAEFNRNGLRIIRGDGDNILNEIHDKDEAASSAGKLAVRLDFDVGSIDISVLEYGKIREGYVLDLERYAEAPVQIRCGAYVVGAGELIEIDRNHLGVRIIELFNKPNAENN